MTTMTKMAIAFANTKGGDRSERYRPSLLSGQHLLLLLDAVVIELLSYIRRFLCFDISGRSGLPDLLDLSVSYYFAQHCFNGCRTDIR